VQILSLWKPWKGQGVPPGTFCPQQAQQRDSSRTTGDTSHKSALHALLTSFKLHSQDKIDEPYRSACIGAKRQASADSLPVVRTGPRRAACGGRPWPRSDIRADISLGAGLVDAMHERLICLRLALVLHDLGHSTHWELGPLIQAQQALLSHVPSYRTLARRASDEGLASTHRWHSTR
jgi:hypothetical protein